MPTKRYSTEQIVSKLRQAEVELSRGLRVPLVDGKKLGISEQTYYRWRTRRKEYGGLRLDQAKRLTGRHSSRRLRVPLVCKKLGISEQTYYRWRKEYGGLRLDQAKRQGLERENTRLKKLVADQALDNAILKEVTSGNF